MVQKKHSMLRLIGELKGSTIAVSLRQLRFTDHRAEAFGRTRSLQVRRSFAQRGRLVECVAPDIQHVRRALVEMDRELDHVVTHVADASAWISFGQRFRGAQSGDHEVIARCWLPWWQESSMTGANVSPWPRRAPDVSAGIEVGIGCRRRPRSISASRRHRHHAQPSN